MALNPIFSLSCPSCGAKVPVYSATSVLVVCEYCKSTLVRSGEAALDSGTKSALIEDFSPIQVNTSGVLNGKPFTIIGRIQIQYDRGYWNEWYALFADGTDGWLGDFSGEYTFTRPVLFEKKLPAIETIKASRTSIQYSGKNFIASDVREAKSIKANAQGELPFTLNADEPVVAADFRCRDDFMTLDYSENREKPLVYLGKAVTLNNLRCEYLRSNDEIIQSAGHLRGGRVPLSCPNCGGSIQWYAGVAENIICPNCHSDIALTLGQTKVMKVHNMREAQIKASTLRIGEEALINGKKWTIIGLVRIQETPGLQTLAYIQDERKSVTFCSDYWFEYLLYHPNQGFQWLVESNRNFTLSQTMPVWPSLLPNGMPSRSTFLYDYGGIVTYAAGSFYWHIKPNDITYYRDFQVEKSKLCAEITQNELNWSLSRPVTGEELARWFKRPELAKVVRNNDLSKHKTFVKFLLIIFFIINLPAYVIQFFSGSEFLLIVQGLISYVAFKMIWMPFEETDD